MLSILVATTLLVQAFESFIRAVRTKSLDFIILYRTVVGRTSDGRRTAVRPSSDRCPTGVRRPSDGRPTAVRKISAKQKICRKFFRRKMFPEKSADLRSGLPIKRGGLPLFEELWQTSQDNLRLGMVVERFLGRLS